MSTNSKKRPRKTKLVPRMYVENEDEIYTAKQVKGRHGARGQQLRPIRPRPPPKVSSRPMKIKIVDVKTLAAESFGTLRCNPALKTYRPRASQSKTKEKLVTESMTAVSQSESTATTTSKTTTVSQLKTSATIVSEYETPQPQTSNMPFQISVNVEVEEFDDEDRLQIDESALEDPEIKMEIDERETEKENEDESEDIIDIQNSNYSLAIGDYQSLRIKDSRNRVETEIGKDNENEFDDVINIQNSNYSLAIGVYSHRIPVKDSQNRVETGKEKEKESDDVINFRNIVIKQERLSPERERDAVNDTDIRIELPANVVIKNEKEDVTSDCIENNVNSDKNNVSSEQNNVNSEQNNKTNQNNVKTKKNNVKTNQNVITTQNNVKSNQNNVNSNQNNVKTNENYITTQMNVNSNQNNVNSNQNNDKANQNNVNSSQNNDKTIQNNVNPNQNTVNPNQFTDNNVMSNILTDTEASNDPNTISQYSVTETQVLTACEKILATSTNIADRILAIEARNIIGRIAKDQTSDNIIDNKIQYALDDWKNWTAGSRRPPPLLYKCYICLQSWWHLSEFREHLLNHTEINIKVSVEETSVEECNIIAYIDMVPEILDVEPTGICWRCEKDYTIHKLSNRQSECYYTCRKCLKQFYSCTALKEHEESSPACVKYVGTFKCYICPSISRIPGERRRHMQRKHTIRTDLPVPMSYKRCNDCGSKYFIYNLHNCRNRICGSQCNFCFRKFRHRLLAELHMHIGNESVKCKICKLVLPKKCMELEHVLMHSTTFIFAYKCKTCEDFNLYLDENGSMQHRYIKHKQKFNTHNNYFDKVLVPISCILPNYESLDIEVQQTVDTINVPIQSMARLPLIPEIKLEVIDDEQIIIKEEPGELIIKEENLSDEEYEDDIIRLNFEHSHSDTNKKKPKIYNCRKCSFKGRHRVYKEHLLTKCGRIDHVMRRPKVYSCIKCNFQGHHSVYKEHLKSDCSKHIFVNEEIYTCTKCDTTFDSIKLYLAHFSSHHYEFLQCPICLVNHQSFSTLIIHFNSHIRQSYFKMYSIQSNDDASQKSNQISLCKTCSQEVSLEQRFVHWETHLSLKDSDSVKDSVQSLMVEDDDPNDEDAPIEGENNYSLLKEEMLKILIENLQCEKKRLRECPQCCRNFQRNNDCKRHIIEHLLSDAYSKWGKFYCLKCQICGQQYKKADKYKRHMRDHGCLPIFQCDVCDKAFSDSSNFTKHKKVHNMKVLICDLCNKKFQAKLSLIKHMEIHKVSKPVSCDICVREFPTDTLYRRHMRTKHDNTLKRNYSCLICKERFYTCKEKWEHAWEVHKERKYKADCGKCGKSFRTITALRRHDREHICPNKTVGKILKRFKSSSVITTKTFRFDNSVMVFVNKDDEGYVNLT